VKKHGHCATYKVSPTYRSWQMMHRRCAGYTPVHKRLYVDRNITVCARWALFENFLEDMGERPNGHTLDRIDGDGHYKPANCHWATHEQQMQNTSQNVNLILKGETKCVAEWAKVLGIPKHRIHARLKRGYAVEEALSTGVFHHRSGRKP